MKRLSKSNLILVFSFLFCLVLASPISLVSQNLNDVIPLNPKVKTGKLANGMTYYIMQNKKPEKRAEFWIKFKVGSVQETEAQRGLAHFIEHMCFNGTKHFPKDSLIKFLEKTGVKFGADINAHTAFDEITYTLTVPTDVPGMLEGGMTVLEDWAMNVSFDSVEIEKERGVILEEERMRMANASGRLTNYHLPNLLKDSRYAVRMPIGLTDVIKTAPKKEFLDYYYDWFRPELTAVMVVGDIDVDAIEALIKKHFSGWKYQGKGTPKTREKYTIPNNKEPIISIAYDKELTNGQAAMIIKHPSRNALTYSAYRENIKESLFAIMFNMRLQEITQEPKPPFLYAGGGIDDFIGNIRCFQLVVVPNKGQFQDGLQKALAEVFRVDQHGFTKTELERAKEQILSSYERMYNERDKTENHAFVNELAGYFEETESAPGIEVEYDLVKKWLPEITAEEINKMVSAQIIHENVIFQVSLPEDTPDKPTAESIMATFDVAAKAQYKPYVDDIGDGKLLKKEPKPGKITSTKELKVGITEMKLSNGARVLLKPTNFKNDQVLFTCYASGGSSLYSDAEYQLVDNAVEIIDNNGLGEYTSTKLSKILQSKQIRVSPYLSDYEQGIGGSFTPKDRDIFFQLLYMQFTEPRIDNDAFESWKNKSIEAVRGRKNNPMSDYRDTLMALMSGYSPRSKPLEVDDIDAMNQQRAFDIYKDRFADASNFTFVFVGSFKIDEIKSLLEKYIASLPSTNKAEKAKDLGIKPVPGIVSKIVKRGIEPKSQVYITLDFDYPEFSSESNMKVGLLSEILAIKVRESLREDKGGVYSPGAWISSGYLPRKFVRPTITFSCDPKRVDELVQAVKDVIDNIQKGIDNDDLIKAKEILKKENQTDIETNNFWLNNIASFDKSKRDVTFLTDGYAAKVDKVTAKDLVELSKKYLNYKNHFINVIQMPEDDDE